MADKSIPDTGAIFTFGKNKISDQIARFWIPNDPILKIAAGDEHSALITAKGRLFTFGSNEWGQLGIGHTNPINKPLCVKELKDKRCVLAACGRTHTLVATDTGEVYGFGGNVEGQITGSNTVFSLPHRIQFSENIRVKALAAGGEHSLLLTDKGVIYVWGNNSEGQLGLGEKVSNARTPLILKFESQSPNLGAMAITAGYYHSVIIDADGKVYTFGETDSGKLGLSDVRLKNHHKPQSLSEIKRKAVCISGGGNHTIILTADGKVYSFGDGSRGQLGLGNKVLKANRPMLIKALESAKVARVYCGDVHTVFLTDKGQAYVCGDERNGKLGLDSGDSFSNVYTPTLITNLFDYQIQEVACGGCHTIILATKQKMPSPSSIPQQLPKLIETVSPAGSRKRRRLKKKSNITTVTKTDLPSPSTFKSYIGFEAPFEEVSTLIKGNSATANSPQKLGLKKQLKPKKILKAKKTAVQNNRVELKKAEEYPTICDSTDESEFEEERKTEVPLGVKKMTDLSKLKRNRFKEITDESEFEMLKNQEDYSRTKEVTDVSEFVELRQTEESPRVKEIVDESELKELRKHEESPRVKEITDDSEFEELKKNNKFKVAKQINQDPNDEKHIYLPTDIIHLGTGGKKVPLLTKEMCLEYGLDVNLPDEKTSLESNELLVEPKEGLPISKNELYDQISEDDEVVIYNYTMHTEFKKEKGDHFIDLKNKISFDSERELISEKLSDSKICHDSEVEDQSKNEINLKSVDQEQLTQITDVRSISSSSNDEPSDEENKKENSQDSEKKSIKKHYMGGSNTLFEKAKNDDSIRHMDSEDESQREEDWAAPQDGPLFTNNSLVTSTSSSASDVSMPLSQKAITKMINDQDNGEDLQAKKNDSKETPSRISTWFSFRKKKKKDLVNEKTDSDKIANENGDTNSSKNEESLEEINEDPKAIVEPSPTTSNVKSKTEPDAKPKTCSIV